jgi:YggT family protein
MGILVTVAWVIARAVDVLMLVILVNALLSWIHPKPSNALVQIIERVSDTICNPIRRLVPTIVGGLDLSPMIAMVLLVVLRNVLVRVLLG